MGEHIPLQWQIRPIIANPNHEPNPNPKTPTPIPTLVADSPAREQTRPIRHLRSAQFCYGTHVFVRSRRRPPPPGNRWVSVFTNFLITQLATGMAHIERHATKTAFERAVFSKLARPHVKKKKIPSWEEDRAQLVSAASSEG